LGEGHFVAVCSPRHPLAGAKAVAPRDIADQRVATTGPATGTRRSVEGWFEREGLALHNVMEVSSHEEIRITALQNLAIGFVGQATVAEDLEAGRLVQLDLANFDVSRPGYVSYRKGLTEPATWLVDLLVREHAAQLVTSNR
jgi:DNA-binding transcriptional LysR family regulator